MEREEYKVADFFVASDLGVCFKGTPVIETRTILRIGYVLITAKTLLKIYFVP